MSESQAARRLEALSDIVFGLAMTSLATRLPLPGVTDPAPTWHTLVAFLGSVVTRLTGRRATPGRGRTGFVSH